VNHTVGVRLPDGRHAVAGIDDPVVEAMRRVNKKLSEGKPGAELDYAEVAAWLDAQVSKVEEQVQLELPLWEAAA
jgi:hypothetical protein